MTMGERIKQLRKEFGMTQEELGKYIGVKKAAILKYEKGDVQNMKRASIEKLSKLFNVSPSYLMCMDELSNENSDIFKYQTLTDEMAPLLDIDDIAIIKKIKDNNFEDKRTYLIKYDQNMIIRKIIDNGNSAIDLIAMNPYYKTITTTKDKIEIIGEVLEAHNSSAFKKKGIK